MVLSQFETWRLIFMEPAERQLALVITEAQSDTPREKSAILEKNRDLKEMGRADRAWSEHTPQEADAGPTLPYTLTLNLFAPTLLPVIRSKTFADQLPVEILSKIFLHCLPDNFVFLPCTTMAPVILSQICGYWRQVALATPNLWVIVSVSGRRHYDSSYLSLLRLWMERSLDHAMFLHFWPAAGGHVEDDPAFELFLNHSHHWGSFSLTLSNQICKQLLASPISGSPLVTLRLDATDCSCNKADEIAESLNRFPHLRRFQYTRLSTTSFKNTQWSRMTHISLDFYLSGNECIDILAGCAQVEDFRVSQIGTHADRTSSREIVLPNLFYLQLSSNQGFQTILNRLACPALRTLELRTGDGSFNRSHSEAVQSFVNFITHSECKLESLSICEYILPEDDIITCLQTPGLKSLRALELDSGNLGANTLKLFKYQEDADTDILLPSLHTLWLRSRSSENEAIEAFGLDRKSVV